MKRTLKRREFLYLSAAATLGAVAAACAGPAPEVIEEEPTTVSEEPTAVAPEVKPTAAEQPTPVPAAEVAEPPFLAERVAGGELPPLADRLPLNPFVVANRDSIGTYGGEFRQIHHDPVWTTATYEMYVEQVLKFDDMDLRTLIPHAIESWETSDDGQTHSFHMRQGMKWSDGEPLTTAAVDFWWNDFANVETLGYIGAAFNGIQNKPCTIDILDDYTFTASFDYSFGLFPQVLARHSAGMQDGPFMPGHYLKQFHQKYADPEFLQNQIDSLGVEMWEQVFGHYENWGMNYWQFPADGKPYPSLAAWIPVEYPQEGTILFERNPYYWKVDQAGNQLPYVDTMRLDYVASTDAMNMKAIQGEIDYLGQHDVSISEYPLYKENEEAGHYIVGDYLSCMGDRFVLFPRLTQPEDPVLEQIVQHENWVKALSLAIDREEINQSVYYGMARMGQISPMPVSKYFKQEYADAYAQYDPDQANQLLDDMGLTEKDSEGFRLRPDGQRLSYNIEHTGIRIGLGAPKFTEMVTTYWRAIGIEATTKEIAENLYNERMQADQVNCGVWHADRCTDLLLPVEMYWYIPTGSYAQGGCSAAWSQWYTAEDKEAEGLVEPPDYIKQIYEWRDQMKAVVDEDERVQWGQKIFDYLAERPLEVGSIVECPLPLLFNKNLRNLPRPKVPVGWDTYGVFTYHPEAFYYEGGERA